MYACWLPETFKSILACGGLYMCIRMSWILIDCHAPIVICYANIPIMLTPLIIPFTTTTCTLLMLKVYLTSKDINLLYTHELIISL